MQFDVLYKYDQLSSIHPKLVYFVCNQKLNCRDDKSSEDQSGYGRCSRCITGLCIEKPQLYFLFCGHQLVGWIIR